jgi:methionine-R-sulfoxide reductase
MGLFGNATDTAAPEPKMKKSMDEWRAELTPEQFHVMFEKGTERAFTGKLVNNHEDGVYHCGACNAPLFTSDTKFESGSGWPSFWEPVSKDAVITHEDRYEENRSDVRQLRRSPRAHLPRRTQTDGRTVLHQLRLTSV